MTALKPGVRVEGLQVPALIAVLVARDVYAKHDQLERFVLTSMTDGQHKVGSLHYTGNAFDVRLPSSDLDAILNALTDRLTDQYDVVLEADHIHIEYDP